MMTVRTLVVLLLAAAPGLGFAPVRRGLLAPPRVRLSTYSPAGDQLESLLAAEELVDAARSTIEPSFDSIDLEALMMGGVPAQGAAAATATARVGSFMPFEREQEQHGQPQLAAAAAVTSPAEEKEGLSAATARLILIVVAAVYGTNFGCIKLMEDELPCSASMAARFAVATLFLLPACFKAPPKVVLAGMETGLWGAIAYLAQAVSLHGIDGVAQDAGKSGFICALVCLVVPVLEAMIGKMPTSRTWIAAGVATVGIGLLEMGDMAPGAGGLSSSDLVSLLQPIGFGLGFWRMETFSRKYPDGALPLAAGQVLSTGIISGLWALSEAGYLGPEGFMGMNTLLGGPDALVAGGGVGGEGSAAMLASWMDTIVSSPTLFATIMWTGIATTALTILGETMALSKLSATETTLIFSSEPLWAAAFANVVLGETMGPSAAAGGALIVGACAWSALGGEGDEAAVSAAEVAEVVKVAEVAEVAEVVQVAKTEPAVPVLVAAHIGAVEADLESATTTPSELELATAGSR